MAQDEPEKCSKLLCSVVGLLSTFTTKVYTIYIVHTIFIIFYLISRFTFIENNKRSYLKKARLGSGCKSFLYVILWGLL